MNTQTAILNIRTALKQHPRPIATMAGDIVTLHNAARANIAPADREALQTDDPALLKYYNGRLTQEKLKFLFAEMARLDKPPISPRDLEIFNGLYLALAIEILKHDHRLSKAHKYRIFQEMETIHATITQNKTEEFISRWSPGDKDALNFLCEGALFGNHLHTIWSVHRLLPSLSESPLELRQTRDTQLLSIAYDVAAALLAHPHRAAPAPCQTRKYPRPAQDFATLARAALQPGNDGVCLLGRLALAAIRTNTAGSDAGLLIGFLTLRAQMDEIIGPLDA